ncbi:hypothetical protein AGR3A_pa70104 [Agrobacterium tomkonis CFBP 6623]|uniref:Uncharacterized protein n=1 Tax=Agrobacterium tomkonis CFBP 6623 TaxID=1183432 RepID=A0A1S7SB75_9HYPH|nr:hypothetical protein AGR3A_pa70104 [Agrobacterium tomkonis CFBP 6623]
MRRSNPVYPLSSMRKHSMSVFPGMSIRLSLLLRGISSRFLLSYPFS